MKDAQSGKKKRRNYPRRSDIKIVPQTIVKDDPEEIVPTETEMKMALEEKIFGGYMPRSERKLKPQRTGVSDRKGRGGRNEIIDKNAPEPFVLGAVDYMLGHGVDEESQKGDMIQTTLHLKSLFKSGRRRRKMAEIDFENISEDEEEFRGPYIKKSERLSGNKVRKSKRLQGRHSSDTNDDAEIENTNISPSRIPNLRRSQ